MKKQRLMVCLLTAALLIGAALGGNWAYQTNWRPRIESHNSNTPCTTFVPFSCKLFDVIPERISSIYLKRHFIEYMIDTVQNYEENRDRYESEYWAASQEEIEEVVDLFNSFRYYFWLPSGATVDGRPGFPQMQKYAGDGAWYLYMPQYSKFVINYKNKNGVVGYFTKNSVWVDGAWYYGSSGLYDALMALE